MPHTREPLEPELRYSHHFGSRRTRVDECWAILTAEALYTCLLRDDTVDVKPGASGSYTWVLPGRTLNATWELRQNHVWRFGRLFFTCPACTHRATRLYIPTPDAPLACRKCSGLTYESKQRSYTNLNVFGLGITSRALTHTLTHAVRMGQRAASITRNLERHAIRRFHNVDFGSEQDGAARAHQDGSA